MELEPSTAQNAITVIEFIDALIESAIGHITIGATAAWLVCKIIYGDKKKERKEETKNLKQETAALKDKVDELRRDNDSLRRDNDAVRKNNINLSKWLPPSPQQNETPKEQTIDSPVK